MAFRSSVFSLLISIKIWLCRVGLAGLKSSSFRDWIRFWMISGRFKIFSFWAILRSRSSNRCRSFSCSWRSWIRLWARVRLLVEVVLVCCSARLRRDLWVRALRILSARMAVFLLVCARWAISVWFSSGCLWISAAAMKVLAGSRWLWISGGSRHGSGFRMAWLAVKKPFSVREWMAWRVVLGESRHALAMSVIFLGRLYRANS